MPATRTVRPSSLRWPTSSSLPAVAALLLATCTNGFAQVAERPADAWAELNAQVQQAYRDQQYQRGAELGAEALALAEKRFGSQDTRTIMSANNLALNYDALGRLDAAEPLFLRALQSHERVYGPDHPLTLVSLTNLAGLYQLRGRFDEAETMLRRVVDARVRQFGEDSADTARARHNLQALQRARAAAHPETLATTAPAAALPAPTPTPAMVAAATPVAATTPAAAAMPVAVATPVAAATPMAAAAPIAAATPAAVATPVAVATVSPEPSPMAALAGIDLATIAFEDGAGHPPANRFHGLTSFLPIMPLNDAFADARDVKAGRFFPRPAAISGHVEQVADSPAVAPEMRVASAPIAAAAAAPDPAPVATPAGIDFAAIAFRGDEAGHSAVNRIRGLTSFLPIAPSVDAFADARDVKAGPSRTGPTTISGHVERVAESLAVPPAPIASAPETDQPILIVDLAALNFGETDEVKGDMVTTAEPKDAASDPP